MPEFSFLDHCIRTCQSFLSAYKWYWQSQMVTSYHNISNCVWNWDQAAINTHIRTDIYHKDHFTAASSSLVKLVLHWQPPPKSNLCTLQVSQSCPGAIVWILLSTQIIVCIASLSFRAHMATVMPPPCTVKLPPFIVLFHFRDRVPIPPLLSVAVTTRSEQSEPSECHMIAVAAASNAPSYCVPRRRGPLLLLHSHPLCFVCTIEATMAWALPHAFNSSCSAVTVHILL